MKNFCPVVYFKDEKTGENKAYRLMVYIGHRTMLALLFDYDFKFDYDFLKKLESTPTTESPSSTFKNIRFDQFQEKYEEET